MVAAVRGMSDEEERQMEERQSETVVVVSAGTLSRRYWGVMLAAGIVAIIFGIIVLANLWGSVRLVAILAGLFLIFAGVVQFVNAAGAERKSGKIIGGLVILIVGLVPFAPARYGRGGRVLACRCNLTIRSRHAPPPDQSHALVTRAPVIGHSSGHSRYLSCLHAIGV